MSRPCSSAVSSGGSSEIRIAPADQRGNAPTSIASLNETGRVDAPGHCCCSGSPPQQPPPHRRHDQQHHDHHHHHRPPLRLRRRPVLRRHPLPAVVALLRVLRDPLAAMRARHDARLVVIVLVRSIRRLRVLPVVVIDGRPVRLEQLRPVILIPIAQACLAMLRSVKSSRPTSVGTQRNTSAPPPPSPPAARTA